MKYLAHVPTESYGFISVEVEGTAEDAVEAYVELQRANKNVGEGLSQKDFNEWIDGFLSARKAGSVEQWEKMSFTQKLVINEIKKAHKRLFN